MILQRFKNLFSTQTEEVMPSTVVDWANQNQYTPDIWQLEQFEWQHIFVPYSFRTDFSSEEEMLDTVRLGRPTHPVCYTSQEYNFFVKDLGIKSFPIPLPSEFATENFLRWPVIPARIKGVLWSIPPKLFISLDKRKQNGVQFRRERVRITLPWREVKYDEKSPLPHITDDFVVTKNAWMYIGVADYWQDQIGGIFQSCQVEHKEFLSPKKWIDRFYEFETP